MGRPFYFIDTRLLIDIILKTGDIMQTLIKLFIGTMICLLMTAAGFSAERVVVCEMIGDES
jgi:hypothetical protein